MKREIIIVIIIIIAIIALDLITNNYTKESFAMIDLKLDEIKEIGNRLENEKKMAQEYGVEMQNDKTENDKEMLESKLADLEEKWQVINQKTSFYLEHDELEKVNSSITKFKSYFELEEYTEAIPELENCKYILKHIEKKEAINPINLF